MRFERGCEQRGQVEGGEDGHAVADCEEGECGEGDGAGGPCGAEELGEFVVFVEAEGEVGGAGCEEFGGAGGGGGGWGRVERGGCRVDGVGGEVGSEVEGLWGGLVEVLEVMGWSRRTKMRTNGFEVMKRCGFRSSSWALFFRLSPKVFRPLAFSMMPLSIMVMMGATSAPAAPADMASTPTRNPSFDVFQSRFVTSDKSLFAIAALAPELDEVKPGSGSFGFGIVDGIGVLKSAIAVISASATGCGIASFAGTFKVLLFSSPIAAFCGD